MMRGGVGVTEDAVQLRVLTMRVGSGEPNVDLNGELWDVNSVNPGVAYVISSSQLKTEEGVALSLCA